MPERGMLCCLAVILAGCWLKRKAIKLLWISSAFGLALGKQKDVRRKEKLVGLLLPFLWHFTHFWGKIGHMPCFFELKMYKNMDSY